ncbi:MAG: hypothetical protein LBV43_08085 [Prevotella sp.]|jgi:hypothetical protein|nr:hypothetical protein [Prevotella sp.]
MKKILFTILLIISFSTYSQTNPFVKSAKLRQSNDSILQYRDFEEFNNDTLEYLEYNFVKRSPDLYAGMTVREFIDMLPFPIVRISVSDISWIAYSNGDYPAAALSIVYEPNKNPIDNKWAKLFIEIGLDTPVTRKEGWGLKERIGEYIKDKIVIYAIIDSWRLEHYRKLIANRKELEEAQKAAEAEDDRP